MAAGLLLCGACAPVSSTRPAAEPSPPIDLPALYRIVSLPVNDSLEDLETFSRLELPLDVFVSVSAGAEPLVCRVVSRATLINISGGRDGRPSSVMVAVPRDEVEVLLLTRELARRNQASFYLAGAPRKATAGEEKQKSLPLAAMLSRLGAPAPERRPVPPVPAAAPASAPAPIAAPAPPAAEVFPLPDQLPAGHILIDGSSTVFPMAKRIRDDFRRRYPAVHIDLMGVNPGESPSGSGGGFKKFCFAEIDLSNASRFMKDEELKKCGSNAISFLELPLAYDGLSVVVNRETPWIEHLSVADLKAIWAQDSRMQTWRDVRPDFPKQPILLFGPGRDSGTYDFFNEAVFGKPQMPRADAVASENDEVLVQGIVATPGAIGYFGLAYYIEHRDELKIVAIDGGKGPVLPTHDTVLDGSYAPFSRPLFLYVNTRSLQRPEVAAFVRYFLKESSRVTQAAGYIPLPDDQHRLSLERLRKGIEGSMRPLGQPAGPLRSMMAKP